MCGIAGFYQNQFDYTKNEHFRILLNKMKESLLRRGPTDNGLCLYSHCGLAHTRLAIIDPLHGKQPMVKASFHDDNGEHFCCISYNGEIYNTAELRALLKKYPLAFETTSDTEVILNGYIAYGCDFIEKLNGIFALAIYDSRLDMLILARDHLGVKPLFYQQVKGIDSYSSRENISLVFGSEPKALFAFGISPKLDNESWGEVLGLGPARTPGHGVFAGMKEVLPGHLLCISGSNITDKAFWSLESHPHTDSYAQTIEKVSWLVQDSIKRQMVSDVPICTFLSGGLDSSFVSAVCSRELKKEGKQLSTFSFDFVGNRENFRPNAFQSSLDRPFADIMVSHIGSKHTFLECDNLKQADGLLDAVIARDLPCMADVESSLLYFCSEVAKTNRVTLTGECADEIFGGYPWFHREEMWKQDHFPWVPDMTPRTSLLREDFLRETHVEEYAKSAYEASLSETPRLFGESPQEARRREIAWLNIRWFMATLLNRMDRTSMYCGLEARVPFADYRILDYVFNIPWEMKCHGGITKSLLVEAGEGILPKEILYRKKSPYPKTYDTSYEKLLAKRLKVILAKKSAPLLTIVDEKKVFVFLESVKDYGRPWYGQLMAGPQMIAYLLQINYWMEHYRL